MGWIAKGQSGDYRTEQALFGLQPGGVSSPRRLLSDGYHLYSVEASEQRTGLRRAGRAIRANAFSDWYSRRRALPKTTTRSPPTRP